MGPGFTTAPNLEGNQLVLPPQGTPMTARGPQPRREWARQCPEGTALSGRLSWTQGLICWAAPRALRSTCAYRRCLIRPFSSQTWPGGTVLPSADTVVGCVFGGCSPGPSWGPHVGLGPHQWTFRAEATLRLRPGCVEGPGC